MKSLLVFGRTFIIVTTLFLSSCLYVFENSVSGNGNVVTETRNVGSFSGIHGSSGLNIIVTFGDASEDIEVVADENLQEIIKNEVSGNVLRISTRENIRNARSKDIFVSAGSLEVIELSSAADFVAENMLDTRNLRIGVSSAAKLELEVNADKIDVNISSSGNATLQGTANELSASVSSAGDLQAEELVVDKCRVNVSSAGDASVYVAKELDADASSAGHITYRGNPESRKVNSSSAGSISQR
jgi:hypothetical protein